MLVFEWSTSISRLKLDRRKELALRGTAVDSRTKGNGARGFVSESASVYVHDTSGNASGVPLCRQNVPKFARYKHDPIGFTRGEGPNWVFAMANESSHGVDAADPEFSVGYMKTSYGKDVVAAHMRARRSRVASLEGI